MRNIHMSSSCCNSQFTIMSQSNTKLEISNSSQRNPSWFEVWPQILSSLIALSSAIQVGIHVAYSGILIPQLADDPDINKFTKDQASWIASLPLISQPIGTIFIGSLMDIIGRKKTYIISTIPILAGWILIYFTKSSLWPIYLARILGGLAGGTCAVGTVYTAEISHPKFRPMLLAMASVNVAFGILITTVIGVYIEWHTGAIFYGSLTLISFILSFFIPESPYWLANFTDAPTKKIKSQVEYLNRSKWLFDGEWTLIQRLIDERREGVRQEKCATSSLIKKFCERTSYLPLLLLVILFFLQQTSGTYVVIYYTVNIFKSIGNLGQGFDEYNATTALGIIRFTVSSVSAVLSMKVGRRVLLISSTVGMAISCTITAIFLKLNNIYKVSFESENLTPTIIPPTNTSIINEMESYTETLHPVIDSWWILISLLAFVGAGALGQMSIPWTLMSELLPTKVRATGSGILMAYSSLILFIILKTFPVFTDFITLPYVFVIYAVMTIVAVIFIYFYLPETFGKNFVEIAKYFEKK